MTTDAMRRLLIVEDETDVRDFLNRAFGRIATRAIVDTAQNGAEALDLLLQYHYDLVVSDNRMPLMTGIEMISAVRSHGLVVPILIFSADITVERAALAAGATAFLHKPIALDTILTIVGRWL